MSPESGSELAIVEQREVTFYGDELVAVKVADGQVYVPVRPLCELLGVSWTGQRRRINRDDVLSDVTRSVNVTFTEPNRTRQINMICLPLEYINGFLFGINAGRVKPELKERINRYRRDCYRVLAEAFQEPTALDPLAQVEQLGRALITLAREQREFDNRLGETEEKIGNIDQRVIILEERTAPSNQITDAQASQISQAVKAVAMKLSEKTGRNEYGGVYGELYRKFEITSYKLLPVGEFKDAMTWLSEWYQQIAGEDWTL